MDEEAVLKKTTSAEFMAFLNARNKEKSLQELVAEQEKFCSTEFDNNIITNKYDMVKLYLERDKKLNIDSERCVKFAIIKLFRSPYSNRMAANYFKEDIIYNYRNSGNQHEDEYDNMIRNEIMCLQDMEYNDALFVSSKYAKQMKDRYAYIMSKIDTYFADSKLFYNDLTFGELLVLGY